MAARTSRFAFGAPTILLVGVAVLSLAFVVWGPPPPVLGPTNTNGEPATSPTPAPEVLAAERRYRESLQALFAGWETSSARKDFAALSKELLAISVPGRYRALHLDLVIAISYLQSGQAASDQGNIEQGISLLEKIFTANPWILETQP